MKRLMLVVLMLQGCAVGRGVGGSIEAVGEGGTQIFAGAGTIVAGIGRAINHASGNEVSVARGMKDQREVRGRSTSSTDFLASSPAFSDRRAEFAF